MRKLISHMHISLDGFAAGPNGELDFAYVDEVIHDELSVYLSRVDTAIFGRNTYQIMESYWPHVTAESPRDEREHAAWVNPVAKIAVSSTLESVDWQNTRLVKGDLREIFSELKQQDGKDMMVFGSPRLVHALQRLDLIDEYKITVNPVFLGEGIPMFKDVIPHHKLKLVESKTFSPGVLGLRYEVQH